MIDSSLVETAVLAHQQFKVRQSISSAAHLTQVTDDFPAALPRPANMRNKYFDNRGSGVLVYLCGAVWCGVVVCFGFSCGVVAVSLPGETH